MLDKYINLKLGTLATFLGVIIFNVDIGLYIGLAFSILLIIFNSQRARVSVIGNIPGTSIFESVDICLDVFKTNKLKFISF